MELSEARYLARRPSYTSPTVGENGALASAGAHALSGMLKEQSAKGVMDLLRSMDTQSMADVLSECGFSVPENLVSMGRNALFNGVRDDLQAALSHGVDGHGLREKMTTQLVESASKESSPPPRAHSNVGGDFAGEHQAAHMVQAILNASRVQVTHLGQQPFHERPALQMIAAQALHKDILGFGFDGLAGKYEVTAPMPDVVQLHRQAAIEVATESTRAGLLAWASGQKVTQLSEWVPDSVQRLLSGSISRDAAEIITSGLKSGSIARHAQEYGSHGISRILADKGLDINAPTLAEQAQELGLLVKEPDRERGHYFGSVVAQDHQSSLVKVNRDEGVELPFASTPGTRPKIGDVLRLSFKAGALSVSTKNMGREGNARD
ncbi:hypothetical protein CBP36_21440 (plasmid) [Acidovorax carolinensis]|uniref:Uncharacterized protein n=1 Tax=Acidovorax carolinensis TaxID=553814 RepID=A0A240UKI1_9BURK|nr:hypothetical protein [Acidovorax carolinensis]ART61530.1 hypothetical protein CBP36_21440 [Acidovorax carolinensis]